MKRLLWLSVLMLLGSVSLLAQVRVNTVHVFPQMVGGPTADGDFYVSFLTLNNVNSFDVNCTITPFGSLAQYYPLKTLKLPARNYYVSDFAGGAGPLVSGYVRINCTGPITAELTYGSMGGIATVFSMDPVTSAVHFPLINPGFSFHYGIAIANDAAYSIQIVLNLLINGKTLGKLVTVPANSQLVTFLDDLFTIPAAHDGVLEAVTVNGPFYITALLYSGKTFGTAVPF